MSEFTLSLFPGIGLLDIWQLVCLWTLDLLFALTIARLLK
jgi:hypothetical protein